MLFCFYSLVVALGVCTSYAQRPSGLPFVKDGNGYDLPKYSPARPPAIPLAVRNPYTSAWSSTGEGGTLNTNNVRFWGGQDIGWEGIVSVDGISYEYLGAGSNDIPVLENFRAAKPKSVTYDSQYSNFTFSAGPVEITASFFSPVIPADLCRTSVPLSYLTTSVQSTDNRTHRIAFYGDVNTKWIVADDNSTVEWDFHQGSKSLNNTRILEGSSSVYTWLARLKNPSQFFEQSSDSQLPLWGNLSYSSSTMGAANFTYQSSRSIDSRYSFAMSQFLSDYVDPDFRASSHKEPVVAFAHGFGNVSQASVRYTLGVVQDEVIQYITNKGIKQLAPWWSTCYGDIYQMISFHWHDFAESQRLAHNFERRLQQDVREYYTYADDSDMVHEDVAPAYTNGTDQFGNPYLWDPSTAYGFLSPNNFSGIAVPDVSEANAYYSILALSTRQVMGALTIAAPPAGDASEPLVFMKEISSDGNVNTVDVIYPSMPFFVYANPDLLKYLLEPLMQIQEGGYYPNKASMHDIGGSFPNATSHVEGNDEFMPVEESGDMIIMVYTLYRVTGNADYLQKHYALLKQFAQYLIEFSLIPSNQVSTDDFAGALANQTNLAIKGIIGLAAMAKISDVVGQDADATNFSATASSYLKQWEFLGIDPSKKHTLLGYQWRSSWGLLYNVYPDKLCDLGIIPEHIYEMQSKWYKTVSQAFGVPLDNRGVRTKSDWQMWTAATCAPETRRLFVNGLAYWLNNTSSDQPFPDLYDTTTGDDGGFRARPVVGGHFALLALQKANDASKKKLGGVGPAAPAFNTTPSSWRTSRPELPLPMPTSAAAMFL